MYCCFHRCWHKWPPDQYIDFEIKYLFVLRAIQLLSNICADFLKVLTAGDLQVAAVQLRSCKLVLGPSHKSPCAWNAHTPHWSLRARKRNIISLPLLKTRCWILDSVPHWSPNAWENRIMTQLLIPRAVWSTRLRRWESVLRSGFSIPNMLALMSPPQALLRSFFPELSSTWCSVFFLSKESGCRKTSKNSWCWTNEEDGSTHHAWNDQVSTYELVGSWCQHIWFGFSGSNLTLSNKPI